MNMKEEPREDEELAETERPEKRPCSWSPAEWADYEMEDRPDDNE